MSDDMVRCLIFNASFLIRPASLACLLIAVWLGGASQVAAQPCEEERCIFPEQHCLDIRPPEGLSPAEVPNLGRPKTISELEQTFEIYHLSLDEAIQVALANAEVIRILSGTTATSSGRTIYDPAIANTNIDAQRAQFDPVLQTGAGSPNGFSRTEQLFVNPLDDGMTPPTITGAEVVTGDNRQFNFDAGLTQMTARGGTKSLSFNTNSSRNNGRLFNPQNASDLTFGYTHPLLRGRGTCVNLAPIVIARINTERSFYQLKDSVQELVRSVVDGYWSLVQARVELWARQQQVAQLEYAFKRLDAQRRVELADLGDTAQAKVSLEQFRANLITTEAQLLDLEAAFFNVMGLPPVPNMRIVPVTPPVRQRIDTEWDQLVATASEQRPNIIERKLSIEAIQQQLIVNCNNTLPQLDAVGTAGVSGLAARNTPIGTVRSDAFQATNVQIGLQLRTPLGQRAARAALREQQLSLARERANLRQDLHAATHSLAQSIRSLESFYQQYEAFQKVREASKTNLDRRFEVVRVGGLPDEPLVYLDVLQAVTDWGNSVSSEAQALTRYNAEIANLERQTGVILGRHGIIFDEEGYQSLAPFGNCYNSECDCYPQRTPVQPNAPRYEAGTKPAEEAFNLQDSALGKPGNKKSKEPNAYKELLNDLLEQEAKPAELPADADKKTPRSPGELPPGDKQKPTFEPKKIPASEKRTLRAIEDLQNSLETTDRTSDPIELIQAPNVFRKLNYTEPRPAEPVIRPANRRPLKFTTPVQAKSSQPYRSAVKTLQFLKRLPAPTE